MIRRREFIAVVGGAVAWPVVARAQQEAERRIGVLVWSREDEPLVQAQLGAFTRGLAELGWKQRPQRADRYPLRPR
jgi:putative ABC transport system substrate-binding protein